MNFLTIIVYNQGKEIGRCNNTSLNVKTYESIREFTFRNYKVSVPQSFDNSGYSYINFSMYMETKSGNSRELSKLKILPASEANFEKNGDVKVYGHLIPDRSIDYYNQYEVDILHSWSEGWGVNWHSPMISIEQKQALLRMRGFYSGVPHSIRGKEGELNGSDIFHFEDFYLSLGELIIGEKGYFGSCYDSLLNCLIECSKNGNISYILRVIDSDRIKEVLGNKYFDEIFNLLKQYNFEIKIE